jgi:uncharacterized protein (DUF2252 family)
VESVEERYQRGKALRSEVPRSSHAEFTRSPDVDPVTLLLSQEEGRLPDLIPVRHQRMGESAYAFYRAGAMLMASDLATTPTTGLTVQLCGDAHLANFGWYGSPERQLVFDINDFDETLPGSFEWDLKRLAASFVIAAADNGVDPADRESIVRTCVSEYRDSMAKFAGEGLLDVWYEQIVAGKVLEDLKAAGEDLRAKDVKKLSKKARRQDSLRVLGKLTESVDGRHRFKNDAPFLVPISDIDASPIPPAEVSSIVEHTIATYTESMQDHLAALLRRFTLVDVALKVVGVGSVGTRCFAVLLTGRDDGDPLFLQVKEATASVLEDQFDESSYDHHGRRVVEGQRAMQTSSDPFLGWTSSPLGVQFYVRQLKDMKASFDIAQFGVAEFQRYSAACAWTLAQAHARTGDAVVLSAYMGSGDVFADAITAFALAYAEQNDEDFSAFDTAVGFSDASDDSSSAA